MNCSKNIVITLSTQNWFEDLLRLVDQNKDLCQVLIGPHGDTSFIRQLMYLGYDNSMKMWHKMYPNADESTMDFSFAYLANGVIGILENWISNDYNPSIDKVGELLMGISMKGLDFMKGEDK